MEELRTREGASWRSTMKLLQALGKGTKYERRNLIGYLDGLKNFRHKEDVYKRQVLQSVVGDPVQIRLPGGVELPRHDQPAALGAARAPELRPGVEQPVSYTHLDVYKRQVRSSYSTSSDF